VSKRTKFLLAIGVIATLVFALQIAAFATHYQATLEGSNFEIDNNANLVNDPNNSLIDWVDLADVDNPMGLEEDEWPELRARDLATGQNDNSYKGGVKEDTSCPDEVTGSIPNNKSDLRTFHVYEEPGTGDHPGFLNLAWSRVTDPSGTTLMDFEFNQADADDPAAQCAQGPNVVRQPGDLLIEYSIDQGGARASITVREWGGTAWGPAESLTTPRPECPDGLTSNDPPSGEDWGPCASGTINTSPITAANSDKIITAGQLNARTFGEAQVDLRYIFDSESCESFGTAMLKSRSSDSFTSQLKDFIAPIGISLQNCGSVIVEKVDDAGNPLPGATFQLFQDNEPPNPVTKIRTPKPAT
jgi:hypothetical protein